MGLTGPHEHIILFTILYFPLLRVRERELFLLQVMPSGEKLEL